MLPDKTWPELAEQMKATRSKALKNGERPVQIEISDKDYPAYMGKNPKEVYFTLKMRSLFTVEERRVDALLRGYLLTGDERYKKLGVQRAIELEQLRLNRSYSILGKQIPMKDHAFYNTVPLLMLDAFYTDLPAEQQKTFVELALSLMDKHGNGHPHLHDQLEHAHFNQHDWQGDIKNLIVGSAILCRYRPEFEDWFKYAYELWLYRSPALEPHRRRFDGRQRLSRRSRRTADACELDAVPADRLQLLRYKRWFANFPVYMSYMNAVGNPGVPYSDGGDGSPGVPYLTEMLAYMCPENPANLWRFKSQGRRDANEFSKDLVKGYKAMAVLLLWQHFKAPDLSKAQPRTGVGRRVPRCRHGGHAQRHPRPVAQPDGQLSVPRSTAPSNICIRRRTRSASPTAASRSSGAPATTTAEQIHDALSYKCSRAHNTIMADGLVQGFDLGAYGWIAALRHRQAHQLRARRRLPRLQRHVPQIRHHRTRRAAQPKSTNRDVP